MASRLAQIASRAVTSDEKFMVAVAKAAVKARNAAKSYYKCKGTDPDEKRTLLIASKDAEKELDDILATQDDPAQSKFELPEHRVMKMPEPEPLFGDA